MENVKEKYGIEPMTFDEEMNLWRDHEWMAQTRNNKRRMIDALNKIAAESRALIETIKAIPVEDEVKHAMLVDALCVDIESLQKELADVYDKHAYSYFH